MTRFKPWTFRVGSDYSINWATTTAPNSSNFYQHNNDNVADYTGSDYKNDMCLIISEDLFNFDSYSVNSIDLDVAGYASSIGSGCTVSGWGALNVIATFKSFFKKGHSWPLFNLFSVFSKKHYNFYNNIMWKNVHPVSGTGIWTYNLLNPSLLP